MGSWARGTVSAAATSMVLRKYASSASSWNSPKCSARFVLRLRLTTCMPWSMAQRRPAANTLPLPVSLGPRTRTL